MNTVLVLCLFAAAAAAHHTHETKMHNYGHTTRSNPIAILSYKQNIRSNGGGDSSFETGNGIKQQEDTQVVAAPERLMDDGYGKKVKVGSSLKKTGSYSYTAPDGQLVSMSYVADETGFHATGTHIPVAPEIPAEIAKSLKSHHHDSYSTPLRMHHTYSAPAAPVHTSYSAPAAPVHTSYSAPAAPVHTSYAAPVRKMEKTYTAPVHKEHSYSAHKTPEIRINYESKKVHTSGY